MNTVGIGEGAIVEGSTIDVDCNHCGFRNVFQGTFSAQRVGGRLQVIFEDMSVSQLRQAREALQAALRQPDATVDDVAASVEKTSAGFAAWIREFASHNKDVIGLVDTLLAAIAVMLIIGQAVTKEDPAPQAVNKVDIDVRIQVERIERGDPIIRPPYPRRQPCLCGSGKRYKNCHGREDARYKDSEPPR